MESRIGNVFLFASFLQLKFWAHHEPGKSFDKFLHPLSFLLRRPRVQSIVTTIEKIKQGFAFERLRQLLDKGATLFFCYRKQQYKPLRRFNASISGGLVIKYFYTVIETVFCPSGLLLSPVALSPLWCTVICQNVRFSRWISLDL